MRKKKGCETRKDSNFVLREAKNARLRAKLMGDLCHHKYEGALNEFHFLKKFALTN